MPVIQADGIADLIAATLKNLGRLKITDLMSDLQNYVALGSILNTKKVSFRSGTGIQFNVQTRRGTSAKHTGLFGVDTVNVGDGIVQGSIPWRHYTFNYAYDRREIVMNSGDPEQIVDLIAERRAQELTGFAALTEEDFWSKPADSSDNEMPFGLLYWVVKNATEGFNGGNPTGFTAGCAGLSSTTYPRWKNWTAQYTNVSKDDLITKMRKAAFYTKFVSPVPGRDAKSYNTGDDMGWYTNYSVTATMERILERQNDNLGNDVAPKDGQTMFKGRPIVAVPYLDNDTTNPVYGVNWGVFKPVFLKGEFMREDPPEKMVGKQHTTYVVNNDTSVNYICYDRRRLCVIYK